MGINRKAIAAVCAALSLTCAAEEDDEDYLEIWPKDPGLFLFVNTQTAVPAEALRMAVNGATAGFGRNVRFVTGTAPGTDAVPAALAALGARGAIWIVNDPARPVSLAANEDGWGFLNVAPIIADRPDGTKLAARLAKYVCRLFATIHGAGAPAMMPGCVMMHAPDREALDRMRCATYSPETMGKISDFLTLAGYKPCNRGSYLQACEEGWAPAPTNAAQKAIWDKVHALPTAPIRLKPAKK